MLPSKFQSVHHLRLSRNTGFTGACNVGLRSAFLEGADFVLLLNNDTTVGSTLISDLLQVARRFGPRVAVSPRIVWFDDPQRDWYLGGRIDRWTGIPTLLDSSQLESALEADPVALDTEWLSGCAMLLSRDAYTGAGEFSGDYFSGYEDIDLSLRLARNGYRLLVARSAIVNHRISATIGGTGFQRFFDARNRLLFLRSHGQRGAAGYQSVRMLGGAVKHGIKALIRGNRPEFARRLFDGVGAFAFLVGQRGDAPPIIWSLGSRRIR